MVGRRRSSSSSSSNSSSSNNNHHHHVLFTYIQHAMPLMFESGTFGSPFHSNHSNHWITTVEPDSYFVCSHTESQVISLR